MLYDILSLVTEEEIRFFTALCFSILAGLIMGIEREARHKDAGISTHILVITGSMLFTFLSDMVESENSARIAAQVVSGIGFLGAGLIIKEGISVRNLTTAASLWFAAAIGMSFGFGFYLVGMVGALMGVLIPRIPHLNEKGTCATCGTKNPE
jgi:putative Mg2+ transporter-C (MgtC) family protein